MFNLRCSAWLLIFFAALTSCDLSERNQPKENAPLAESVVAYDSLIQLTGIVQSSGLSAEEKERLGYTDLAFQLITREAYFLSGADSLLSLWGKCVTVRAKSLPIPDSLFAYERKILQVVAVYPQPYAICQYSDSLSPYPNYASESLSGRVVRHRRPAPDIAYDYALLPAEPFYDEFSQIDPNRRIDTLPLIAPDFLSLQQLEEAVSQQKEVFLQGWRQRGYAESLSFLLKPEQPVQ